MNETGDSNMETVTITGSGIRGKIFQNSTFELKKKKDAGEKWKLEIDLTNSNFSEPGKADLVIIEIAKAYCTFNTVKNSVSKDSPLDGYDPVKGETEDQTISRISERFNILAELTEAASCGVIKSLIVSGPAGIGKSYICEETLRSCSFMTEYFHNNNGKAHFEVITGAEISPIGCYQLLYRNAAKERVLVIDDSDSALLNMETLALLKAALNTSEKRIISWATESRILENIGIPTRFQFEGACIFISNIDFTKCRSAKLEPHLNALLSRSHYLDLCIHGLRERYLRIKDIVVNSTMTNKWEMDPDQKIELMDYIKTNVSRFRAFDLRTVIKTSEIFMAKPNNWRRICEVTLMK